MTEQNMNGETVQANEWASPGETIAALRAARTSHPLTTTYESDAYDGAMAKAILPGAALEAGEADALAAERAASGATMVAVQNDVRAITQRIDYLREQLDRHSFDPRTGQRVSALPAHIEAAHSVELQGLLEEIDVSYRTLNAIQQRDAKAAAQRQLSDEADAMAVEFHGHNPARKAALDKAMLDVEASITAQRILSRKYGLG